VDNPAKERGDLENRDTWFLQRFLQHREYRNGKEMMGKGNNG